MCGSASRFFRETSGATALEFGLLAGPTLLTICAGMPVGLNYYMVASLDHAAITAARAVSTGAVSTAGLSAASFRTQIVCPNLPGAFNCNNVFVNMSIVPVGNYPSSYYSYVKLNQSGLVIPPLDNTKDSFCPGAGSQYIVLQILYPAPYFLGVLTPGGAATYNGQSVNVMMATATFRSEPYTGSTTYQGC